MTVSIDAGHVRAARGHQGRTFEVMAAQVSNDDGQPVLFSGVPSEADQQHTQLNGLLSGLGMTADTEVTILSDGADVRALRLIQHTLAVVEAKAERKTAAARSAAKLTRALIALETYVSGLADLIIDYASAQPDDEPFSTSPTEGAVQWLLHRRMGAQQQMR